MITKFYNYSILLEKKYNIINNYIEYDNIYANFYQVPFILGKKGICIKGKDDYVLCLSDSYVYDYITDSDIKKHLKKDLIDVDITTDWTNIKTDSFNFETAYTNKDKHILRICKLIQEMKKNMPIKPINMFFDERAYLCDIKNYIDDGNHRIRALQYLKYDYYPAYIYGNFSEYLIEYLKNNS